MSNTGSQADEQKTDTLKFTTKTIKFAEVMTLAALVNNFVKTSKLMEKMANMESVNGGNYFKIFTEIPEIIFESEESMKSFLHIVEYCFGIDVDDTKGVETMKLIDKTLDFIKEVGVMSFLFKTTTTLRSLISG